MMHWYGGSIAEAVTLSKQKNAIFVVFVEGENDLSTEMAATIDDSVVLKRLSNEQNFLAIKLMSGSSNYTHFAQIYQFVPVPSLFFIGRNGTPLEVVCAGVQPSNLATRIDRILEEHHKDKSPDQMQPSTSALNMKQETVNLLQSEGAGNSASENTASGNVASGHVTVAPTKITHPIDVESETSSGPAPKIQKTVHHEVTRSGKEYDVVCDGDVCVRVPSTKPDDPGPSSAPPVLADEPEVIAPAPTDSVSSTDDKVVRAKELIDARRREKEDKEKELEKQKEMERRATGQGVAELKRWQADQELKQIQEERKREKMENNLARQRILEQIAQDRAERRARDNPPPAPPVAQYSQQPPPSESASRPRVDPSGDGSPRARIQFKLPDGTSHTAHFDAEGTLADVRRYVADNLQMTTTSFSLWTAFPRRELTENDATLRRLELAPSAALLVLPRRNTVAAVAAPSTFSALIAFVTQIFASFVLEPSQQLYTWLRLRLFPPPPPPAPAAGPPPPPPARAAPPPPPPAPRRRGNIHRLPGDRATDDDNNTWNGNSTQQM